MWDRGRPNPDQQTADDLALERLQESCRHTARINPASRRCLRCQAFVGYPDQNGDAA